MVLGSYVSTNNDALYVRKIDEKGNTVWFKNLDENPLAGIIVTGRELIKIDDENFAVTYEHYYDDNDWRVQLVKFDIEGNIIFHKEFANTEISRNTRQLITTQDKGFAFVGGKKIYNPLSLATFYLMKTDSLDNQEWEQTYDFNGFSSIAYSIAQTPDGGYILGGYTQTGSDNTNNDMFVVKTDSLGNEEWSKKMGWGWDDCSAIVHCLTSVERYQQTGEIEYLILGCYIDEFSSAENRYEIYLFKLDTEGDLIWEQGHNPYYISNSLGTHLVMSDGSFYGVGSRSKNLKDRPVLYRFDALGQLL